MAIIVEDGTIVANANSYVTRAEAIAYATNRGKTSLFPSTTATDEILIRAADYLEAQTGYLGYVTDEDQTLQWPRTNAVINDFLLDDDVIPLILKQAQIEVALAIASGVDVTATTSGKFATMKKVGPIETRYSEAVGFGTVQMPLVAALLARLLGIGALGGLRTYRV